MCWLKFWKKSLLGCRFCKFCAKKLLKSLFLQSCSTKASNLNTPAKVATEFKVAQTIKNHPIIESLGSFCNDFENNSFLTKFSDLLANEKKNHFESFLAKTGKTDLLELIFFKTKTYIFFHGKFQCWKRILMRPLVAKREEIFFAPGQRRNVHRYQKGYCIFRTGFLAVFVWFKPTNLH